MIKYISKYLTIEQQTILKELLGSEQLKLKFVDYDWNFRGFFGAGPHHFETCKLGK